ncbi:MAG: hypothetical protein VCB82_11575, partial [Alphaproteobacteria bacterium]
NLAIPLLLIHPNSGFENFGLCVRNRFARHTLILKGRTTWSILGQGKQKNRRKLRLNVGANNGV